MTHKQHEALLERYDDGSLKGTGYHYNKRTITNGLVMAGYFKLVNGKLKLTEQAINYINSINNG